MAQPTNYNKTRNFTDWQAANPNTVYTGADMDNEFDDIETTLDGVLTNLAIIQRDDGKLANLSVHQDALSAGVLTLIASTWTPRGLWVTATAYIVGDVVESSNASYVCAVAHTAGVFATDHTAGKWIVIAGSVSATGVVVSPVGALVATDAQAAFQELDADLTAHISDMVDAHDASAISNAPSGGQTATTVQGAIDSVKPLAKDHGAKPANYTLQIDEADLHVVSFTAAATLTIASTKTNDRAIVIVKNGGFAIALSGIDEGAPTLTNGASKQDYLGIVKSFGKINCVGSQLNMSTV